MASSIWSFDSETALIRPGVTAPEMACLTWLTVGESAAGILHARDARDLLHSKLYDPSVTLSGANTAFDAAVVCSNFPEFVDQVFKAYDDDRVTDVQIREKLLDIAAGRYQGFHSESGGWIKPKYSLADVARKYGMDLDKPQKVKGPDGKMIEDPRHTRLRYGELIPLRVEDWDEIAAGRGFTGPSPTVYAKEDSVVTAVAHVAQEKHAVPYLRLQYEQARRAFALALCSAWGVRTNPERVAKLAQRTEQERDKIAERLREVGFVRADGSRDTKAAAAYMRKVCRESGLKVPLTKTGAEKRKADKNIPLEDLEDKYTALSEDACDMTEDPLLMDYADYTRLGTVLNKDCAALMKGTVYPIHTRFDIAATGRTTSSKPNMQNWGRGVGPRECFVPRPGYVFLQADYEMLELRTLAQVCIKLFGRSALADALNAGLDPHLIVAAKILGMAYDEAKKHKKRPDVDNARQVGKVFNFGKPGGLGNEKLLLWARKTYDVTFDADPQRALEKAEQYTDDWMTAFPEMELYFEYINRLCANPTRMANVEVPISGWLRGLAPYCAACNTNFQSLGASAAGRGIWLLAKACYVDRKSILFGSRNVVHVHDENIGETKIDRMLHEKAHAWSERMETGANDFLPDVPAKAPPVIMSYWSKGAFAVKDADGRLAPWNGEWVCDGSGGPKGVKLPSCGKLFTGPTPPEQHTCANHTRESELKAA